MTHFTKHAGLPLVSAAIMVFLQCTAVIAVHAAAPAAVLKQERAVVTIYDENAGRGQIAAGKGFFIDKSGVIAVPYEVISGMIQQPEYVVFIRTGEGFYLQAEEVVAADKLRGIALLKADLEDPPTVTLRRGHDPTPESVFIGGISGPDKAPASGKIVMLPGGKEAVLLTGPISPADAGSPVLNPDGDVVGMLGGRKEGGAAAYRLISASSIADLLNRYRESRPNPEREPGSTEDAGPDQEELRAELEKAKMLVDQEPGDAKAFVMLGWAYSRLGMYADAIDAYRSAASLKPGSAGIYNNLGVIYGMNMGMFDKAIAEFRKALQLKPDYDEARFNLAIAYAFSDDLDSAMNEYLNLQKTDPERAAKLLAIIHEKQDREENPQELPETPPN